MLPPVDPATLSTNPKFNALYQDLYNNKLNADGTSKLDAKAQRERDGLGEVCGSWGLFNQWLRLQVSLVEA